MTLNSNSCILGFDTEYSKANIIVFGAPFDGTTSYRPGTRFGSSAIRSESFGMETYSPYIDADLSDILAHDAGDIDLPFGNTELALSYIEEWTEKVVNDGKKPLMLGGEHLVSLPAVSAVFKRFPNLCLIHLDAHTDLREDYLGVKLSHAAVIRRIWEKIGDNRIWQFGIRSGERVEFQWAKQHTHLYPFCLNQDGISTMLSTLKDEPVYLTIDLDVLDPSVFPGTGTPEHGGISYRELLDFLHRVKPLNLVGADLVELSPHYDPSGRSTAATCTILRELALVMGLK